ncbi:MAG: precorrin-2 C(20)-methyltransferase [Paracoccus sp. (in: a-proteobacteria)]|nr:precorrin-2 C(20)-methyltransferase [Paracoccus sp. (in: a-proteobacteria)]
MSREGKIYGVGLGPGAPDLMSVRADRLLRGASHIAYFRKAGRAGRARAIAEGIMPQTATEIAMEYPVTTEIALDDPAYNRALSEFYAAQAARLAALSAQGRDVVVLCEGDPFFYGSFMHLHARLAGAVPVEIVPGITGMSGAWTASGQPITWGDDVLTVLTATLPEDELARRLRGTDAAVVMKIGRNMAKLRRACETAGRASDAFVVQYAQMPQQSVTRLSDAPESVPYFTILLIHGQGRRP